VPQIESRPSKIIADLDSRRIQIDWADGHASIYEFTYLRRNCPCASCQPWKEGLGPIGQISEAARRATGDLRRVADIGQVGNYALSFNWTDGHGSGIYSFDYLRALCPCPDHVGPAGIEQEQ
jgi:DUF971 family protein